MNRQKFRGLRGALGAAAMALAIGSGPAAFGQTIPNPSFETNTFTVAPGYVIDNAEIAGWTTDNPFGVGLNPAGGESPYANNGAVPNGQNVAFLSGGASLGTVVSNLTAGAIYKMTLRANAPTNQNSPVLRVNLDGTDLMALNIYSVGSTNPWAYLAFEFTAAADTAQLTLANDAPAAEEALLIDDLTIAATTGRWTVAPWGDDASSGVDLQYVYTHAYNFGAAANPVVNGVPFTGVAGANPAVAGKFAATHFPNVFNNDANNITGGGSLMGRDFVYSGAAVTAGTYQTINLEGLTPGTEYVATIFSAGWESPTTGSRWATLSFGEDRLTVNQDQFDNDNGIRFEYRYTAGADGRAALNIAPVNSANVSIHVYGFANREAVSRNVAPGILIEPRNVTVAEGLPIELSVGAGGFPAPGFQWRLNGSNIQGASSGTYSIAQGTAQSAGNYDVIVSNLLGSVTSQVARVTIALPMANASFEADSFISWPGYSGDNPGSANTPAGPNIAITGWTQSSLERSGLNPIATGESPFADNGVIPHGRQVAFVQSSGEEVNTLSQTVSGLTSGSQYYLHYYENSRQGTAQPLLEVMLGDSVAVPSHLVPAGAYREISSDVFTAASGSIDITFSKSSPGGADTTVLIDNVALVPVAANSAPSIIRQPVGAWVATGGSVSLSAQVLGSLPLTYQWLRDGAPVADATNVVLNLSNLQPAASGEYTLRITNSGGSATTAPVRLRVNAVAGLYNTGVDNSGVGLADGAVDAHYKLVVNPQTASTDALVEDSTLFPIVAGPWLANSPTSKWIGPEVNTVASAVGLYTYRLVIDLTDRDPNSLLISGRWATDNVGREIQVNGVSIGAAESPGFGGYTAFTISSANVKLNAGTNHIDFIVDNVVDPGYTGLRVDILDSDIRPAGSGAGPTLRIARTGASIDISWDGTGQLESAENVEGPWSLVPGSGDPYRTGASSGRRYFRVQR